MGITSDRLGRRKAIAFGCIWGVIGGAIMAGAAHVAMRKSVFILWLNILTVVVIIGRMLVGFAVGTITGVSPVFGAEIAKVRRSYNNRHIATDHFSDS